MMYTLPPATLQTPTPKSGLEISVEASTKSKGRGTFRPYAVTIAPESSEAQFMETGSTASRYRLSFSDNPSWTSRNEREFLSLARKEALDTITPPEAEKLEALDRMRNALNAKRTFREILEQKRQFQKAEKLIVALHEYLDTTH